MTDQALEDLLRELAPQVLGAVVRRYGNFDVAEDAVQEAQIAATTQWPHEGVPDDHEVAGLLALMLLTDARREARTSPHGELIPMAEQDRGLWNADLIEEGVALVTAALRDAKAGPYVLQAAIAAVHDEAPSSGSPSSTGYRPPGPTLWRCSATTPQRVTPTRRPPNEAPISSSSATFTSRSPGSPQLTADADLEKRRQRA